MGRKKSWLEEQTSRKVLLHLKDADSIEGILIGVYDDGLSLVHARLLKAGATAASTEMSGETFVPRSQVVLAQQ